MPAQPGSYSAPIVVARPCTLPHVFRTDLHARHAPPISSHIQVDSDLCCRYARVLAAWASVTPTPELGAVVPGLYYYDRIERPQLRHPTRILGLAVTIGGYIVGPGAGAEPGNRAGRRRIDNVFINGDSGRRAGA